MNNPGEQFNKAEKFFRDGRLENALEIYLKLQKDKELASFCNYRIAQISNMIGDPEKAYELYYTAFKAMPTIASKLLSKEHSSFYYIFRGKKEEKEQAECPLCGGESVPRWCYPLVEAGGYNSFFNPVRMWMYCEPCHHMFARSFPEKLFLLVEDQLNANPIFFSYYSKILQAMREKGYAMGMSLFEIGIGACECLLAAREIGYETFGIDVIERFVEAAKSKYGLHAETADFIEFETEQKYDVIIMGDVIEHVSDPILAMKKAESLLKDDGALWLSTPNFESAFTIAVGHSDPMRRQQYHINYFSRESLYKMLAECGLVPVDYQISSHYNGSMEVIAIKQSRLQED